jgi:hypothetical protein
MNTCLRVGAKVGSVAQLSKRARASSMVMRIMMVTLIANSHPLDEKSSSEL